MGVGIFGQSKEKLVEGRIVSKVGISSLQSGDFLLSEDIDMKEPSTSLRYKIKSGDFSLST